MEQLEIGYAEHARRLLQFLRTRFAESRPLTMFAVRHAEERHLSAEIGAPCDQASARQRLVVWMGKHGE